MADGDGEAAKRWLGMFALGRDDEDMASGELNYHPQTGITLRTLDWVPTENIQHRDPIRQYPALKGVIEGTRPCTILHAFETNVGGGRLEQSRIVGNAILLDGHCNDPTAPIYRRVRFRSSAFTAVAHPHGIHVKLNISKRQSKVVGEPRKPVEAPWGAHTLVLSSLLDAPSSQAWDGTYNMAERPYLEIRFAEPVSFDEVWRLLTALEFIACVGDGEFSGPPEVSLWTEAVTIARRVRKAPAKATQLQAPAKAAQLLWSQSWYRSVNARHPLHRSFVLDMLGPKPLVTLARWLDVSKRVERLTALYIAATESPNVESKFLFLIQSIEGLHRTLDARPGLDQMEFDRGVTAMKDAIPADLSPEARQFLADRVPRHNDPSLRSRLREYGARVTQALPGVLPKFADDRNAITVFRDEFSHAFEGDDTRIAEEHGRALLYYCEALRLLFEFNLLHHLGIASTQLGVIFKRRFKNLVRQRSELIKPRLRNGLALK